MELHLLQELGSSASNSNEVVIASIIREGEMPLNFTRAEAVPYEPGATTLAASVKVETGVSLNSLAYTWRGPSKAFLMMARVGCEFWHAARLT